MKHIKVTSQADVEKQVREFMQENRVKAVVGFSGGAADELSGLPADDELQHEFKSLKVRHHTKIITEAIKLFRGYPVAILSGGTQGGVPEIAMEVAKQFGFPTIGVLPECGIKYAIRDKLDLLVSVAPVLGESFWGDEGPVWTALSDAVIVLGGGAGTLTECSHIMKINEKLMKNKLPMKFMVPIHETGGFAEQLHNLWAKPAVRKDSMPAEFVYSGSDAARLLVARLSLDEYFDPSSF